MTYPAKAIREHLGLTQSALAHELDCSQSNISFYEKGQTVPPDVAKKFVLLVRQRGMELTLDQIYGLAPLPFTAKHVAPAVQPKAVA